MKYLSAPVCELLHKLGVKCETGMWHTKTKSFNGKEFILEIKNERAIKDRGKYYIVKRIAPAFLISELITDSEAMKAIFGEEKVDQYGEIIPLFIANDFPDNRSNWQYQAHHLLGDLLSGDYEAAEQLLVEALERKSATS